MPAFLIGFLTILATAAKVAASVLVAIPSRYKAEASVAVLAVAAAALAPDRGYLCLLATLALALLVVGYKLGETHP